MTLYPDIQDDLIPQHIGCYYTSHTRCPYTLIYNMPVYPDIQYALIPLYPDIQYALIP